MKSYKVKDLADKISKKHNVIGIRNGEKMFEVLMTEEEKKRAIEKKNMWVLKTSN